MIKDAPHHSLSGKCKLNQHWDATTTLLEWLPSRKPSTANADKDVEQQELSLLIGMKNGTATLIDSSEDSYKTKHIPTIQFINHTLWYLFKEDDKHIHTKNCT